MEKLHVKTKNQKLVREYLRWERELECHTIVCYYLTLTYRTQVLPIDRRETVSEVPLLVKY